MEEDVEAFERLADETGVDRVRMRWRRVADVEEELKGTRWVTLAAIGLVLFVFLPVWIIQTWFATPVGKTGLP